MLKIPDIRVEDLLSAGVHFGHNADRWNPKMAPYIYTKFNKTHIINLDATSQLLKVAMKKVYDVVKNNGKILFVGTKRQAAKHIKQIAIDCDQHYVDFRWLGGMLTNWKTIKSSISRLEGLEDLLSDEKQSSVYTKKELLDLSRKRDKLSQVVGGIRSMKSLPDLLVITDINKEHIALKEARHLGIDTVALVDTNANPDLVTFPIPGNDDKSQSIEIILAFLTKAIVSAVESSLLDIGVEVDKDSDVKSIMDNIKNSDLSDRNKSDTLNSEDQT